MKPIATLDDAEFSSLVKASVDMPDAPLPMVRAAVELWPSLAPSGLGAVAGSALKRIRAVLSFDSWTVSPAALGLRATQTSESRHLMFSAPGRDIDVRIVSGNDSYVLAGQILSPDENGAVELSVNTDEQAARVIHKCELDDLGSFRIDNLRAGTYWMTLSVNNDVVDLPPIQVGARR